VICTGNGSLYGTHPFYWYFIAGVPALTGILFPVLIYDLLFGTRNSATRNLWTVIACYVIAHSWSEHKEFRFLLPILPMICLLCGTRIQNMLSDTGPSRRKQIAIACSVPNLVAILYLGLIHQLAPIEVNRAILKAVAAAGNPPTDTIQVHYLMGCHSTPLLSHLHDPPTKFLPWYLDCSPECRKNPKIDCESDEFSKDPDYFTKETYFDCDDGNENEDQTCYRAEKGSVKLRNVPDYLVCGADDLQKMKLSLASMGMKEIGRFVNGINGIRILNSITLQDDAFSNSESLNIGPFGSSILLSYDEIILLQRL
jgi:phosphatidylinositol glycan class B